MTPDRWKQVKEIFHSALQYEPAQRSIFVSSACDGDELLRQEVESLISSHEKDGTFMDSPAYEAAAEMLVNDQELKPGQKIASYEVLSFISRGGMGEVYLAQDRRLGRKVALKLLPASFTRDTDRLGRFEQEARAASALNHPNIITIYEILKVNAAHVIATEFVEGETLRQRLAHTPLNLTQSLHVAIQIADALVAAHQAGIVHRDIKPENVMLRPDGYVKVLDFGLAKLAGTSPSEVAAEAPTQQVRTGSGMVVGTAGYMSPEQARGKAVDVRSDIFSLGAVIYEMVTQRKPFDGETPSDIMASILKTDPPPISQFLDDAPAELVRIVTKTLRKDREERYQMVKDLLIDLRVLKQDLDFQRSRGQGGFDRFETPSPSLPTDSSARGVTPETSEIKHAISTITQSLSMKIKRHKTAAVLAVIAVVLAIVGGSYGLYRVLNKTPAHFQSVKISPLTNSGKVIDATLTPDGRYVIYALSDARKQSIWIRQVSTANDKVIVPPADVGFFGITVSRDGNDLYYAIKQNLDKGTLYRVPIFGGTPTRILEWIDGPVTFSPDGKRMALVRGSFPGEGESALVIVNADGTGEQILARRKRPEGFAPIFFTGPSWSPDGELIAATVSKVGGRSQLIAFRVSDGKEQVLTSSAPPFSARTEWLPDMSGLLVIGGTNASESQVWLVSYPDGATHPLTNDMDQHRAIGLSAKGDKFVTVVQRGLVNVWVVPDGDANRAQQLPVGNLSFYVSGGNGVAWTADGRIVFSSNESSNVDLWIMDADGGNRKQLTSNSGRNVSPVVSRDGRYVVFSSTRTKSPAIWRMDIDGSNPKQLTRGQADLLPALSPDGKWVVYTSLGATKPTIWKVSIDGENAVELRSSVSINPVISPDGKFVAYLYPDSHDPFAPTNRIAVIPFDGGEPIKTFSYQGADRLQTAMQWAADGKSILYTMNRNNVTNIWSQPLDGGPAKQVTDFKDNLMSAFAWSRDGKNLACTRGISLRDAVLISDK
ncbi:MAG TPA: protein kinase [Pyrinomonadaceae bacterium]|nr:protein kinase [Pyrinomonadaceae bacterium]